MATQELWVETEEVTEEELPNLHEPLELVQVVEEIDIIVPEEVYVLHPIEPLPLEEPIILPNHNAYGEIPDVIPRTRFLDPQAPFLGYDVLDYYYWGALPIPDVLMEAFVPPLLHDINLDQIGHTNFDIQDGGNNEWNWNEIWN